MEEKLNGNKRKNQYSKENLNKNIASFIEQGTNEINNLEGNTITFYGKRFNYNNTWAISADGVIPGLEYIEIDTAKFPTISAYQIPSSLITVSTDSFNLLLPLAPQNSLFDDKELILLYCS